IEGEDLSRQIWRRKKNSLAMIPPGMIHVVGTSRWIAGEANRSSLLGKFPISVIPNGLDTDEFAPRDKMFSRDLWGIPRDASVVLFAAESVANVRKGFHHLAGAVSGITGVRKPVLVSVGGGQSPFATDIPYLILGKVNHARAL